MLEPYEVKEFLEDVESRFFLWINKRYGIPAKKFMDIMQAEKDGRLVVLPPCKAGDYIFRIVDMESHSAYKDFVTAEKVLQFGIPIESLFCGTSIIPIEQFGKTVFLTREEAEAELKKREESNERD